nr:MAG: hypothetical protein [Bacteriophage sp.]
MTRSLIRLDNTVRASLNNDCMTNRNDDRRSRARTETDRIVMTNMTETDSDITRGITNGYEDITNGYEDITEGYNAGTNGYNAGTKDGV